MFALWIKIFSSILAVEYQGLHLTENRGYSSTLSFLPSPVLSFSTRLPLDVSEVFRGSAIASRRSGFSALQNAKEAGWGSAFADRTREHGRLNSHVIAAASGGGIPSIVPAGRGPRRQSDPVRAIFPDSLWPRRHPPCECRQNRAAHKSWRTAD